MIQFGFIMALFQTKSFLAYNHFKMKVHSTNTVSKAEFTRNLAEKLIKINYGRKRNRLWKKKREKGTRKGKKRLKNMSYLSF